MKLSPKATSITKKKILATALVDSELSASAPISRVTTTASSIYITIMLRP